ncbi:hypothetical protein DVJ77_16225 [Dyella tabacisoli]|uniref:Uncharacterized protein n=2 Tax=Dyella tabacisoli TaxID=2282381 RepID=A0A369UI68_9GAMM|nr:hypothetical protein DVJ77_16225 [Dyella tabacisoli]
MPLPPTDKTPRLATVSLPSPREAATGAAVYRRRRQERPRDRWLRTLALAGALLVHLLFLFGAVLGPAYDMVEPPEANSVSALKVRLIDKTEPEPPPPPPVRGTPPKEVGPLHRGSTTAQTLVTRQSQAATRADAPLTPVPVPALETPVIAATPPPSAPKPEVVAAPLPPVTLPKPAPTPELQPVPVATEPPQVALDKPQTTTPVPPKFQPEPVRKLQAEGHQPVPPPASLAMPDLPSQSAPTVSAPTIAMERAVPTLAPPSVAQAVRPETPAAPPAPDLQAIPLPAQPAPTVNLQASANTVTPVVPREQPQVQTPAIRVAETQLEAVPLTEAAQPRLERPQAPSLQTPAPKAIALDNKPTLARPQLNAASATAEPASESTASKVAEQAAQSATTNNSSAAKDAVAANTASSGADVSTAPNATPQGSNTATPGAPNGAPESSRTSGKSGLNLALPGQGENQGHGSTAGQNPGGQESAGNGQVGDYVQLKPHGNTEIMSHGRPNIGYKSTRFEDAWTPAGESSIDTALRRAVEKTTVKHTFHLPRGVRIECAVMPLLPMSLFGCGNPDPPAKALNPEIYQRLNLPTTNPLVPPGPATAATAASAASPPIKLDNSVQCAMARVSGGPLPPGCLDDRLTPGRPKPSMPAAAASSWVPASDQFH